MYMYIYIYIHIYIKEGRDIYIYIYIHLYLYIDAYVCVHVSCVYLFSVFIHLMVFIITNTHLATIPIRYHHHQSISYYLYSANI